MKNALTSNRRSSLLLLAALSLALLPAAKAQLSLVYEEGALIGQAYSGPITINFTNFDMGSVYPTLPQNTAVGFGVGGTALNTEAGISQLNATQLAGASGARNVATTINGTPTAAVGPEDSYGIARISSITDAFGRIVWSETGKNAQITVFFYGEKDFYVRQNPAIPGAQDTQEIDGVGLHADFYFQSKTDPTYTPYIDATVLGSSGRTGLPNDQFKDITDGTKILSTVSVSNFLHEDGVAGGLATEFVSNFNRNGAGSGQSYLSVTGGTQASFFNTNTYSGLTPGTTADIFATFTTTPFDINPSVPAADWLVTSAGQAFDTTSAVPEPSTYGLIGASVLVGMAAFRRRFQRQVKA